jgi:hypothetical protein
MSRRMGIRTMVSAVTIVALISTTTSAQERPLILATHAPPTKLASPAMLGAGIGVATLGSVAIVAGVVIVVMSNASLRCSGDLCAATSERFTPLAAASIGTGLTALLAGVVMIAEGSKPVALSEASMPMRWTF